MAYAAQEIRSEEEFTALRGEWEALLAASPSNTIFLTWEWLFEWWRSYRGDRALRGVLIRDAAGRPTAGAVLMTDTVRVPVARRVRALRFVGDGSFDSDYLDIVCRAGEEVGALRALFDCLDAAGDWSVLFLNEIPADSPTLSAIVAECKRRGYAVSQVRCPCAYTPLPADWDSFLARLKPRFRTKVRSLLRSLGEGAGEALEYCREASELDEWLEMLFDLHTRRWRALGQDGVFGYPGKREFYRRMGRRFLERGWLRFSRLRMDGRVVAMQFCFEYANRTFLLQEGFDPECDARDAGNTLRALVFADNIRRGVSAYDFLGGVSAHKLNWAAQVKEGVRLTITRPTAGGRVYRFVTDGGEACKRVIRAVVPDSLIRMGKRLLRTGAEP